MQSSKFPLTAQLKFSINGSFYSLNEFLVNGQCANRAKLNISPELQESFDVAANNIKASN